MAKQKSVKRIGIDLGGTKIEGVVIDSSSKIILRLRVPTPRNDYAKTLDAIQTIVEDLEREAECTASSVGIGTPGTISTLTGRMKNSNSTWLIGKDLVGDLKTRLNREVRIANDANCFALSEAIAGVANGYHLVFGVILGTGVGGGIVINGQLLRGINGIAGEWGHNTLPHIEGSIGELWGDGTAVRTCYCGRENCIETFLSGAGIVRTYQLIHPQAEQINAQDIVLLAEEDDENAQHTVAIYKLQLAVSLAQVINILDPDVIVLGGGLSNITSLYEDIPSLWQPHIFSDEIHTKLLQAQWGDSSGVRGAAWL